MIRSLELYVVSDASRESSWLSLGYWWFFLCCLQGEKTVYYCYGWFIRPSRSLRYWSNFCVAISSSPMSLDVLIQKTGVFLVDTNSDNWKSVKVMDWIGSFNTDLWVTVNIFMPNGTQFIVIHSGSVTLTNHMLHSSYWTLKPPLKVIEI